LANTAAAPWAAVIGFLWAVSSLFADRYVYGHGAGHPRTRRQAKTGLTNGKVFPPFVGYITTGHDARLLIRRARGEAVSRRQEILHTSSPGDSTPFETLIPRDGQPCLSAHLILGLDITDFHYVDQTDRGLPNSVPASDLDNIGLLGRCRLIPPAGWRKGFVRHTLLPPFQPGGDGSRFAALVFRIVPYFRPASSSVAKNGAEGSHPELSFLSRPGS